MNQTLQQIQDQFIERVGFLGTLFGFNKLLGQIYGLLYLSPSAVSLDEITEQLRMSKGNISLNIRELEKWGGCRKVWVKGDRRDYYEAETDFKKMVGKRLLDALKRRVSTVGEIALETQKTFPVSDKELTREEKTQFAFYKKRIHSLAAIQTKLDFFLKTITQLL